MPLDSKGAMKEDEKRVVNTSAREDVDSDKENGDVEKKDCDAIEKDVGDADMKSVHSSDGDEPMMSSTRVPTPNEDGPVDMNDKTLVDEDNESGAHRSPKKSPSKPGPKSRKKVVISDDSEEEEDDDLKKPGPKSKTKQSENSSDVSNAAFEKRDVPEEDNIPKPSESKEEKKSAKKAGPKSKTASKKVFISSSEDEGLNDENEQVSELDEENPDETAGKSAKKRLEFSDEGEGEPSQNDSIKSSEKPGPKSKKASSKPDASQSDRNGEEVNRAPGDSDDGISDHDNSVSMDDASTLKITSFEIEGPYKPGPKSKKPSVQAESTNNQSESNAESSKPQKPGPKSSKKVPDVSDDDMDMAGSDGEPKSPSYCHDSEMPKSDGLLPFFFIEFRSFFPHSPFSPP